MLTLKNEPFGSHQEVLALSRKPRNTLCNATVGGSKCAKKIGFLGRSAEHSRSSLHEVFAGTCTWRLASDGVKISEIANSKGRTT